MFSFDKRCLNHTKMERVVLAVVPSATAIILNRLLSQLAAQCSFHRCCSMTESQSGLLRFCLQDLPGRDRVKRFVYCCSHLGICYLVLSLAAAMFALHTYCHNSTNIRR